MPDYSKQQLNIFFSIYDRIVNPFNSEAFSYETKARFRQSLIHCLIKFFERAYVTFMISSVSA